MKTMATRTYEAHLSAGADADKAAGAAQDMGDLAVEVRVLRWMVGAVLVLVAGLYVMLFQIAIRLPAS